MILTCLSNSGKPRDYQGKRAKPPYKSYRRFKLFLDIVPSSPVDITRALRGCFRGGSVHNVSFRFKAKENLQCCGEVFIDILIITEQY